MTVWDTFFMMLMVIPVSKMLSSIFMKLIARIGTIDEEKYAAMGMGTILAIAAIAGVGKNKVGLLGRGQGATGGGPSSGAGMAGLGESSGAGPAGPSSATMDFLGMDAGGEMGTGASPGGAGVYSESYGAETGATAGFDTGAGTGADLGAGADLGVGGHVPPIGEAPLGGISQKAGDIGDKAAVYGAYTGAIAPVAAPVVAGIMAFTTRAMVGPSVAAHQVTKNLKESYSGYRGDGMGRGDAIARSAMDLTGARSPSEASARILGSVLGSSFGSGGSRVSSNALGSATRFVNDKSAWIKDKIL